MLAAGGVAGYIVTLHGARHRATRFADGRAVLRSSIREYVCSEAMWALGIPTTRALSVVATGEGVVRDKFYSGNVKVWVGRGCASAAWCGMTPAAVVCRLSPELSSREWHRHSFGSARSSCRCPCNRRRC